MVHLSEINENNRFCGIANKPLEEGCSRLTSTGLFENNEVWCVQRWFLLMGLFKQLR